MSAEKLYYQNKKLKRELLTKATVGDVEIHEKVITWELENIDLLTNAYVKRHIIEHIIKR